MGNAGSAGSGNARRRSNSGDHLHSPPPPSLPSPQPAVAQPPEVSGNRYVFAASTPYPPQYTNGVGNPPQYYQFSGYYQHPPPAAMPVPLPAPFDHHHHRISASHGYPYGHVPPPPPIIQPPIVEHQKAVTIRNDVNLKKETLRMVPDEDNPGRFLVAFTFDATVDGSITILFFAKEAFECNLTPMKENLLRPVTVSFKEGLSQKFQQPSGTGIDFSMFTESELTKEGEMEVYPLAVKAEASLDDKQETTNGERGKTRAPNSQITQAVFEKKENGEYRVRVVKQILWVSGTRYELQEIYGIGNSVDGDFDGNDPGKECVICLTNLRDTTVLPCRHMCMCTECAQVLRYQSNRCPICRQPVERLLEIRVHNNSSKGSEELMRGGERAAAASTGGSSNTPNDETKSP